MKKIKQSNNLTIKLITTIICLGIAILIISIIDCILIKKSGLLQQKQNENGNEKIIVESPKISKFKTKIDNIYLATSFDQKYSFVTTNNNEKYKTYIFDYSSGKKLVINDVIKEGFFNKVRTLINLKYPRFISDVITKFDKENVYIFKENELVIYFYNYDITPAITAPLFIIINYNEIYPYLKFKVQLDSDYKNELATDYHENLKYIAFTFDDGPSNYTKELIGILNDNKVNATFFILGSKIKKHNTVLKYMYESNHEIGYHSFNHVNFTHQNITTIKKELDLSNALLNEALGINFKLIRPPYGGINNNVKDNIASPFIFWSVDPQDWRNHDENKIYNHVMMHVKPGDIILFHDSYKTTILAISKLLPILYSQNYRIVSVSKLAKIYNIPLENNHIYRHFSK